MYVKANICMSVGVLPTLNLAVGILRWRTRAMFQRTIGKLLIVAVVGAAY